MENSRVDSPVPNAMKFGSSILFLFLLKIPAIFCWDPDYLLERAMSYIKIIQTQEFLHFFCADCKDYRIDYFIVRLQEKTGLPQFVTTNSTVYQLRNYAKRNYWAFVFTHSIDDPIFKIHDYSLRNWHFYLGCVVFLDPIDDMEIAHNMLFYLYKKRFTNTHLYFASSNLTNSFYGFQTYPRFKAENRPDLTTMEYLAKTVSHSVEGYAFKTPLQIDVPRVFKYRHPNGHIQIQGVSYRIFATFRKYMHGTIKDCPMSDGLSKEVNMQEVLQLIRDGKIDISAHTYAFYQTTDIEQSYPLMVVRWCVMVPSFNQITNYLYPIKPFEPSVWILYSTATLCFIVVSYSYQKLFRKDVSFSRCVLVGLCMMINSAAPQRFIDVSKFEFFLLSLMFLHFGFIMYSYTSFLGSILTVNLFRQQINTMADLIDAQLPVMVIDYELEFLRRITDLPPEFENLIVPVDPDTHAQHRNVFNASYAYLASDDQWHFLNLQQKYLKQPKFRLSDICFGSFHLGFPIQTDSPVWRNLEYFIYRVHSSGLYQYYESIAFDYAVQGGFAQRFTSPNEYPAAGMKHLLMAFQMLCALWALSLIVFVCEIVFKNKKKGK